MQVENGQIVYEKATAAERFTRPFELSLRNIRMPVLGADSDDSMTRPIDEKALLKMTTNQREGV